jgi:predicted XRE-type DNA-binding protein
LEGGDKFGRSDKSPQTVMAALVAATHTLRLRRCSWVAGTSPAMTNLIEIHCAQKSSWRKQMKKKIEYEVSSGNVFADIGLPNAEEHLIKAQLVFRIDGLLKARGLTQADAAKLLGVKQPDISKMLRGDFNQFSVERLMRFLVALGQDVNIVVTPHRGRKDAAQLRVADAPRAA